MKLNDLSPLLNRKPISYYWIGFLLADGHFEEKKIKLVLGQKDQEHLKKYINFISYTGKSISGIKCMDAKIVPKIRQKFNISNRKTYNPSKINHIKNKNLLLSLIIGFIDGDGSIRSQHKRKDNLMTIKCHGSWLSNLQFIADTISSYAGTKKVTAKINKDGYAVVNIANSIALKYLKRKATKLKLPILERKWNKINLSYVSKQEQALIHKQKVSEMLVAGHRQTDIAKKLGLTRSAICLIIRRNNL